MCACARTHTKIRKWWNGAEEWDFLVSCSNAEVSRWFGEFVLLIVVIACLPQMFHPLAYKSGLVIRICVCRGAGFVYSEALGSSRLQTLCFYFVNCSIRVWNHPCYPNLRSPDFRLVGCLPLTDLITHTRSNIFCLGSFSPSPKQATYQIPYQHLTFLKTNVSNCWPLMRQPREKEKPTHIIFIYYENVSRNLGQI